MNATHVNTAYSGLGIGGGSGVTGAEIRHRASYSYSVGMSDTDVQAMMVYLAGLTADPGA